MKTIFPTEKNCPTDEEIMSCNGIISSCFFTFLSRDLVWIDEAERLVLLGLIKNKDENHPIIKKLRQDNGCAIIYPELFTLHKMIMESK